MRYAYFDSEITGTDSDGMPIFDRAENSEMFSMIFSRLITNGVTAAPADCFQVIADTGLKVSVKPGFGVINGRFAYEDRQTSLALAASGSYPRIDRIVLRLSMTGRLVELKVLTGTAAASPVAPDLGRPVSGDYYDLGLATVRIEAGATSVSQSNITDTRADKETCGFVSQLLDGAIDYSTVQQMIDDAIGSVIGGAY